MKIALFNPCPKPSPAMKNTTLLHRLKASLLALALMLATITLVQAQSTYTNAVAANCWGNAINWNPNGIPNAIDAVVTTGGVSVDTTNTTENITASGAFPYIFGTWNGPASGATGPIGASATTARQLRAQVSSGTPTINIPQGTLTFNSVLSGNQGYTKMGAGNLQFRFNSMAQQYTGTVYVVQGAVEMNQDSSLGYVTNSVVLSDLASLTAGLSGGNQTVTVNPLRSIILNAPGGAGRLNWHATGFTNIIQCVISESAAGSGVNIQRAVTQFAGTTGTTMLCNSNTYTGPTIATEGVLVLSNQYAVTLSTLTPNGGTVAFHNGITANAFTVGGLAGTGNLAVQNTTPAAIVLTVGGNNADTAYSGALSGAGSLVKVGTGTLDLQGTANNSSGSVNVSNGIVLLDKTSTGSVHAIANGLVLNGGTARLSGSGSDQIANGNTVTLNSGTFDLNGQTEIIGGLTGNGGTNADSVASGTLQVNVTSGAVTNGSTFTGGNLVFGGAGTQVFAGTDIRDAFIPGMTTTVTNGTFQLGIGGSVVPFGGATGITATSPGTLALNFSGTFTNNVTGSGNVAINSTGTVTLSGSDTHTGNTLVNTGTLALPSGGTTVGGSVITVASNATFNVTAGSLTLNSGQNLTGSGTVAGNYTVANGATNSGKLVLNGNVTLQAGAVLNPGSLSSAGTITNNGSIINAGGYTIVSYLVNANTPGGGTNSLLVVTGNLNVGSIAGGNAAKLIVNGAPLNGTYVIATFGTFTGNAADVQVTGPSGRQTYTLQTSGNQLQLVIGGQAPQSLVWQGDGTANVWDGNNTGNKDWTNTTLNVVDYFAQGDYATFNNASTNPVVNLTGDLLPQAGSVVTVNSTNSYTFTGAGYIDGQVSLTKTNSGALTLQTANTFTGPVNLNGGIISVAAVALNGAASPLGAGTTLAFNGGTLQYTGPNADGTAFNRAVTIDTNGATMDQSGSGYLFITGLISGSGSLTKQGTNQLVVSGNNTGYTNTTFVKNGQVQLRNVNALGNSTSLVIATNDGTSVATGGNLAGTIVKPFTLGGIGDSNGVLQANSTGVVNFSGAINLITNASIGGSGASNLITGTISGAGTLTKVGTGNIVLSQNENYTGGTVISSGTLQLGIGAGGGNNGWTPPMPAAWALTNNGVLAINHTNATVLTNTIVGTGWVHQIGAGTLTLGASNNFTGGNVFNYPTIGLAFTGAVGVDSPVLVTNSYAFGTVGAAATAKVQLAGNIKIPAVIAIWSQGLGATIIENVSGTNSIDQVLGLYGNNYWPITSSGGLLSISTFSNVIFNSTFGRGLELQGAASGSLTNTIDPSFFWLYIQKDGVGTWSLEGSIEAPQGLIVNAGTLVIATNANINPLLRSSVISSTVAGGTLLVNGSLPGKLNVNGGQLGGSGNVGNSVTVLAAGKLFPGAAMTTNTTVLSIGGDLTLGGNAAFTVNKSLAQSNDLVNVGGIATNSAAGTVTVTNRGPALVAGDTFTLFGQSGLGLGVSNGAVLNINHVVLGSHGQYVTWTNNLAVDGSVSVLTAVDVGTNVFLTSLALNPADSLTPAFATNVFLYFATNTVGTLPTVTITNADLTASNVLIVNGLTYQVLTSGVPSLAITNLGVGATNVLKFLITAQDAITTNLYTVNLTQLASTVNTNTFAIGSSVSGTNLNLTWPSDRLGWKLWTQTNALSSGLGTNWSLWPNSTTVTNVSIPINPANPSVFFRMTYP